MSEQVAVKFHPFMDEMTVTLEHEFRAKDNTKMGRVRDAKGRPGTVPMAWIRKLKDAELPDGALVVTGDNVVLVKDSKKARSTNAPWLVKFNNSSDFNEHGFSTATVFGSLKGKVVFNPAPSRDLLS